MTDAPTLGRPWFEHTMAAMIDESEHPGPDESLILYGLDSVRVMALVGALEAGGVAVSFKELMTNPTMAAWWALIEERRPAAPA